MQFTQSDLVHVDNVIKAIKRGQFLLKGEEILTMADGLIWLSGLRSLIEKQTQEPDIKFTEIKS